MLLTERKLSAPDKILITAARIDTEELSSVSLETLVICCWQDNPTDFGINGYADQYPDTNKVICYLSGLRGLVAHGLLERTGSKCYRITETGRGRVKQLQSGERIKRKQKNKPRILTLEQQEFIEKALCSGAYHKWQCGIFESTELKDATSFWMIDSIRGEQLPEQLSRFAVTLSQMEGILKSTGELTTASGMVISLMDVQKILGIHKLLLERYKKHLQILSKRKD